MTNIVVLAMHSSCDHIKHFDVDTYVRGNGAHKGAENYYMFKLCTTGLTCILGPRHDV